MKGLAGAFADVQAFNRAAGREVGDLGDPKFPHADRTELAIRLIREEAEETCDAMLGAVDLPGVADGLADLIYVCLDAAVAFGIDMGPVWDAVQAANMSKFTCMSCKGTGFCFSEDRQQGRTCDDCQGTGHRVYRDAQGKITKPLGWKPPDIEAVLKEQRAAYADKEKED